MPRNWIHAYRPETYRKPPDAVDILDQLIDGCEPVDNGNLDTLCGMDATRPDCVTPDGLRRLISRNQRKADLCPDCAIAIENDADKVH